MKMGERSEGGACCSLLICDHGTVFKGIINEGEDGWEVEAYLLRKLRLKETWSSSSREEN